MQARFKNIPFIPAENREYIDAIKALCSDIFYGYDVGNIGYITSTEENYKYNRNFYLYRKEQYQDCEGNASRELLNPEINEPSSTSENVITNDFLQKTDGLGPLEKGFINHLLSPQKKGCIIYTGARGSGKTALMKYVSKFLKENKLHEKCGFFNKCHRHKDTHLFFDFNRSICNQLRDFFSDLFFVKFKKIICEIYNNDDIIESFIQSSSNGNSSYFDCISDDIKSNGRKWKKLKPEQKITVISKWIIKNYKSDYTTGVKAFYEMLEFYHKQYSREDQTCLVLFFDNIDILEEELQNSIIAEIAKLNQGTNIKTVITSRLTTFNYIKARQSFNFNIYQNAGISPIKLLLKRITFYFENKDAYQTIRAQIRRDFLSAFDSRLAYIYKQLTEKECNNRLSNSLEALSGLSIRRCLQIFRRLFYNTVIHWSDPCPKEGMLLRALYAYDFDDGFMRRDDNRITNIFMTPRKQHLTLLPLRILRALHNARKQEEIITKNDLIEHINLFKKRTTSKDLELAKEVINILRVPEKRLVFISGFGMSEDNLVEKSDSNINLTYAGTLYLEYLCTDFQYIQNCFEIIKWNTKIEGYSTEAIKYVENNCTNNTTKSILVQSLKSLMQVEESIATIGRKGEIDSENFCEKFKFIRIALKYLLHKDIIETLNYKVKYDEDKNLAKYIFEIDELITVPIINNVINSVLAICLSIRQTLELSEEIKEWNNLLFLTQNFNSLIFPDSIYNKSLNRTIKRCLELEKRWDFNP